MSTKKVFSVEQLSTLTAAMEVLHTLGKDGEHPLPPWEWCKLQDYKMILKNVYRGVEDTLAEEANAVLVEAEAKVRAHVAGIVSQHKEGLEAFNALPENVKKFMSFPSEVVIPLQDLLQYFQVGSTLDDVRVAVVGWKYTVPHKSKKIVVSV